jgi:hypothetical protein
MRRISEKIIMKEMKKKERIKNVHFSNGVGYTCSMHLWLGILFISTWDRFSAIFLPQK